MQALERIVAPLSEPFLMFLDPSKRVFWPYLLGSIVVAVMVSLSLRGAGRKHPLRSAVVYSFPWRILTHRSALLDYKLLFAKAALRSILIAPWALSAFGLAVWFVGVLDKHFGVPKASSLSELQITIIYTFALFVAWDFSRYLLHRFLHTVPFLWEFHKVHHSAEVLTPVTLYRNHPVESVLYTLRGVLVTGIVTGVFFYFFRNRAVQYELLGVNALGFVFNLAGANLRHSHVWLSYGRRLEHWFLSPAQHQIHHSRDPEHFNRNFGTWLSIWDWLGGSLRVTGKRQLLQFGLDSEVLNHDPHSVTSALVGPLWGGLKRLWPRNTRTSRLARPR